MKICLLAAFAGSLSVTLLGQQINTLTAKEKAEGWQLLFDGRTLDGWHSSVSPPAPAAASKAPAPVKPTPQAGDLPQQGSNPKPCVTDLGKSISAVPPNAAHWEVVKGLLVACGEPAGYLTSDKTYKNFILSIDFRTGMDSNSGVFVRSPQNSVGYEVQIWRKQPAGYNTGGIVGTAKTARDFKFKPNEWNTFRIEVQGDRIVVVLNGETTVDVRDTKFADGNIRLQYQKFPIEFRNIKLKILS